MREKASLWIYVGILYNKKLTAIDLMIIITQEKGINVGMYLTLCDFEKLNLRILWGSIV